MNDKTIAAVTPINFPQGFPPYINATDLGDGTVRVTVRGNPKTSTGPRICRNSARQDEYRVGDCYPGGPGCNNYCNMHPARRTKEHPDGLPMPDAPEIATFTESGATVSAVILRADWDAFIAAASA